MNQLMVKRNNTKVKRNMTIGSIFDNMTIGVYLNSRMYESSDGKKK